jgi:periplasmic protein TonB
MKGQRGGRILVREQSDAHDHEETPMLATLPESRAPRSRSLGGTIASLLIHGMLIAGAVALTMTGSAGATAGPARPPRDTTIYFPVHHPAAPRLAGPSRTPGSSIAAPPQVPSLKMLPDLRALPPQAVDWSPSTVIADPLTTVGRSGLGGAASLAGPVGLGAPDGVVSEREVDRSPALTGHAPEPRYPDALRAAGITGNVITEFVVDTSGRAEPGSLVVLEATRDEFSEAVRAALPRFRFTPGELAGRRVRKRVRMPFAFTLR